MSPWFKSLTSRWNRSRQWQTRTGIFVCVSTLVVTLKAHAEKILNAVAEEARSAGVTCETVQVEQDHPYEAIIATAKQRGCAVERINL